MIHLAANALTTLAEAQLLLPDADGELAAQQLTLLINQASAQIEAALGRKLGRATYTEPATPSGSQQLMLKQWPIVSVDKIMQNGVELAPGTYSIEDGGILYKDDGWAWRGYPKGLAYDPWAASRDLLITYTAGYILPKDATEEEPATLPADLEGLCLEMVQAAWGKLETGGYGGLRAFSISDVRWEWAAEAPESWQHTLDQYKRWV